MLKNGVFNPGVELPKPHFAYEILNLNPVHSHILSFLHNLCVSRKMANLDKKTLLTLLSTITSLLTVSVMLLQIYSVALIKIHQQRLELEKMHQEAIQERNTALSRYRRLRL